MKHPLTTLILSLTLLSTPSHASFTRNDFFNRSWLSIPSSVASPTYFEYYCVLDTRSPVVFLAFYQIHIRGQLPDFFSINNHFFDRDYLHHYLHVPQNLVPKEDLVQVKFTSDRYLSEPQMWEVALSAHKNASKI